VPPGCCPNSLSSVIATKAPAGELLPTCGFRCAVGYAWQSSIKNCTACPGFESVVRPTNSEWNYMECKWDCITGFASVLGAGGVVTDCRECAGFAVAQGWALPEHGVWRTSDAHAPGHQCTRESWDCMVAGYTADNEAIPAYTANTVARLCCLSAVLPSPLPSNGHWDASSCQFRCNANLFPTVPMPTTDPDTAFFGRCQTCDFLLVQLGVVRWETSMDGRCDGGRCEAMSSIDNPETCHVAILGTFSISGMTARSAREYSAGWAFRNGLGVGIDVPGAGITIAAVTQTQRASRRTHLDVADGGEAEGEDHVWSDAEYAETRPEGGTTSPILRGALAVPGGVASRRAGENVVAVSFVVKAVDPLVALLTEQAILAFGPGAINAALAGAGHTVVASISGSLLLAPSSDTWQCGSGGSGRYSKNEHCQRCCPNDFYSAPLSSDLGRLSWESNGCRWACLASYMGAACLSCAEYREGAFRPEHSTWDDSSPDCTWKCDAGYISSEGRECVSITSITGACSVHTRCASCLEEPHCVFCKDTCVPGEVQLGTSKACPLVNDILSPMCDCEGARCLNECKYDSCEECTKDAFCGWCGNSQRCLLGSYFSPTDEVCAGGWSAGASTTCNPGTQLFVIGAICAGVCSCLVSAMVFYFILRIRAHQREQLQARLRPGRNTGNEAHVAMLRARFLATFPTFKYNTAKALEDQDRFREASGHVEEPAEELGDHLSEEEKIAEVEKRRIARAEEGEDDPVCSICLGCFTDGEDCRMLPCLHVFHTTCIDQWLGVSGECPLCKRDVLGLAIVGGVRPLPGAQTVELAEESVAF